MDLNRNIEELNTFIVTNRLGIAEKLYIIELAKVSQNIDELIDNLDWEKINRI